MRVASAKAYAAAGVGAFFLLAESACSKQIAPVTEIGIRPEPKAAAALEARRFTVTPIRAPFTRARAP